MIVCCETLGMLDRVFKDRDPRDADTIFPKKYNSRATPEFVVISKPHILDEKGITELRTFVPNSW
ncbi:hypothetical protein [Microcoleus sp. herbarium12]|uniref:hypothetical protein n=1 Tax=Microcoleus sp. herbarium12 TaxID=3055437 RepID=UPI002FD5F659